ncbi:hypothetical protein ES702_07580 [subsurface metagenome]
MKLPRSKKIKCGRSRGRKSFTKAPLESRTQKEGGDSMEILEMKASLLEKHNKQFLDDALVAEIFSLLRILITVQEKCVDLENRVRYLEFMNPPKGTLAVGANQPELKTTKHQA